MGSAVLRADHVREDAPPWLLEDTMSEQLIDLDAIEEVRHEIGRWAPDVRAAFRLAHAVRTRQAEDVAVNGLAETRVDYVLLGAGFDTFAWRHPAAAHFRVHEIDHPMTQDWKRRSLRDHGLGELTNVRFDAVDLASIPLERVETPNVATWSCLGVTMYLEPLVTEEILRTIARKGAGTTLVVNFVVADVELDDLSRAVQTTAADVVSRAGEPMRARFARGECVDLLEGAHFAQFSLLDAAALKERYFPRRADLRLPDSTLICIARV